MNLNSRQPVTKYYDSAICWLLTAIGVLTFNLGIQSASYCADIPEKDEKTDATTESAIEKGLAYLARTQSRDGSWVAENGGSYPCTMTSLAGLALLAAGNTPVEGKYAKNIRKATDYLIKRSTSTGLIASMSEESRPMYGHGFAMLFLGQVYGMEPNTERQKRLEKVLKRAIKLTAQAQSDKGGWTYTPGDGDEGSVTVTQIQGLRSCRNAGIKVPKTVIDRACKYIQDCQNRDGGISYSYRTRGRSYPAISAAAVATMYNAGQYENPVAVKALEYTKILLKESSGGKLGRYSGHSFYSMLYASQAMWLSGKENWKGFYPRMKKWLLPMQQKDGSWNGDSVGRVYGTAVALLILQLPKKFLPILQR